MDSIIKNSIDARKSAILNYYNIKDETILNKVEDLFNRINELGESCSDANDFETKFASSPLNQKYTDLLTKVATTCSLKDSFGIETPETKSEGELISEEITDMVKDQADSAVHYVKRQANQEVYDKVRDIPVVGEALEVKQYMDLFGRFKKKKDVDENEDNGDNESSQDK